jgi:tetratricopeptide (TPR) repeat protein
MATTTDLQLQDRAFSERRLGLMILENKDGAALASAIPHLQAALDIWRQLSWPTRIAELHVDLGQLQRKAGNSAQAAKAFREAFSLFAGANDERAIDAAILAGATCLEVNQQVEALEILTRAASLADERNDHLRIAAVQIDLGRAQVAAGNAAAALAAAARAMQIFESFKCHGEVARGHELFAHAHTINGNPQEAVRHFAAAAQLYGELARPVEAGEVLGRLANWHRDRNDLPAAEAVLERALALYLQTGKNGLVAQTLRRLGTIHAKCGEVDKAAQRYTRSLELCRSLDDHDGISRTLYLQGAADIRSGRIDAGLALLQESIAAAHQANLPGLLEPVYAAIARVHRSRGEHDAALAAMQQWVEVLKQQGDRSDALQVLGAIAEIYQDQGAWEEAEAHLQRLVRVTTAPADRDLHARSLRQLSTAEARRGAWSEARAHLTEALEAMADASVETRARLVAQLGHICLRQADALLKAGGPKAVREPPECLQFALEHLQQAERLLVEVGDESALAKVLVDIGNVKALLGLTEEARQAFSRAAETCEKRGDLRATMIIRRGADKL